MFDTDAAIPFTLKGRAVAVAAPAEWRLSRVLRDELDEQLRESGELTSVLPLWSQGS